MDQLPHGGFATAFVRIGAVGDVAVEIFRNRDLGRERAPAFWDLDVFLFENHLAAVVGDLRRAAFPFHLIEWRYRRVAKDALKTQAAIFLSFRPAFSTYGRVFSVY